ncbi:MAG: alpha/beta fold hydrolase [Desulfovibrionales bacterium]|nr:alpha/beta fold hydrolase [Desulfovibrionales bacterium]
MNVYWLLCIPAGILLCGVVFSVASYMLYWYEHQSTFHTIFPSSKQAAAATRSGIISGAIGQSIALTLLPFGALRQLAEKNTPQVPAPAPTPIIFIHGLFHNSSAWALYKHWFKQHGYANCAAFYYSSTHSFDTIAAQLETYLQTFFDQYPDTTPILIGHSLGGLLLRNWVNTTQYAARPRAVITLGAPMHGSKLATFSLRQLGKTLDYNGNLIQSITQHDQPPSSPCFALYSPVDNMVLPQKSVATPPRHWKPVQTKAVSHIAMLSSKSVAEQILNIITSIPA